MSSVVAATSLAIVAACSDDNSTPASQADAAVPTTDATVEVPDANTIPDAAAGTAKFFLGNGVTSIDPAVRVCLFSSTTTDTPSLSDVIDSPPLPNTPGGIGPGEITSFDIPGSSLSGRSFRLGMFYVPSLASFSLSAKSCKDIASSIRPADAGANDPGVLIEGIDYELGPSFTRTFFKDEATYFVLLSGCPKATPLDYAENECNGGADGGFDGKTSQFTTLAYQLDRTTTATAGKNRAQFVFASSGGRQFLYDNAHAPGLVGVGPHYPLADGGAVVEHIPGNAVDGGAQSFIDQSGPLVPAPGVEVTDLKTMDGLQYTFYGTQLPPRVRSVAEMNASSAGFKVNQVEQGKSYTFVFIGTPNVGGTLDDGGMNPAGIHAALLPND